MPAPAVIPAPIAYIKFAAVKKLVVGFQACCGRSRDWVKPDHGELHSNHSRSSFRTAIIVLTDRGGAAGSVTLNKLERSKQADALNTLAWNNKTGLGLCFVGFKEQGMINRDSWGH